MVHHADTVMITGASSGIGLEYARLFAKDGYSLILIANNKQKLDDVADQLHKEFGIPIVTIAKNLTDKNAPTEIYQEVKLHKKNVNILINNAGVGTFGFFAESDLTKEVDEIAINITSLTMLTHLFLQDMLTEKRGRILNMSSGAAFSPGPKMAVYYASKAYVLSFSEALANELSGTGITVTVVCPGPVETNFQGKYHMQGIKMLKHMMSAADVAKAGYQGLFQGKRVVIPGWYTKFQTFGTRLIPRSIAAQIVRNMHQKEGK